MSSIEKQRVSLMFHEVKEKPYRWNLTPDIFMEIIENINFQMDMVTIMHRTTLIILPLKNYLKK